MSVDVYALFRQFVQNILNDRDTAAQYAEDPYGTLAAQGITDSDLSGLNVQQAVGDVVGMGGVPDEARPALQNYCGGGPAPAHHAVQPPPTYSHQPPVDQVVQHLNYVTYVTYEGDDYITQQLINIDNSTNIDNSVDVNIDVAGDLDGDITVDTTNVNATGDGSVANAGDGDVNAATGDGAQVIDGDNYGQANTGDGAVQVGGGNDGVINTGTNTGIIAGDDVDQAVVGDNNQTVHIDGEADGNVFKFGDGDVTNLNDTSITDSAVAVGGDATNVSGNTVDDGSAIAVGGDASGHNQETYDNDYTYQDNDTTNTTTDYDYTYEDNDTLVPGGQSIRTPGAPEQEDSAAA